MRSDWFPGTGWLWSHKAKRKKQPLVLYYGTYSLFDLCIKVLQSIYPVIALIVYMVHYIIVLIVYLACYVIVLIVYLIYYSANILIGGIDHLISQRSLLLCLTLFQSCFLLNIQHNLWWFISLFSVICKPQAARPQTCFGSWGVVSTGPPTKESLANHILNEWMSHSKYSVGHHLDIGHYLGCKYHRCSSSDISHPIWAAGTEHNAIRQHKPLVDVGGAGRMILARVWSVWCELWCVLLLTCHHPSL